MCHHSNTLDAGGGYLGPIQQGAEGHTAVKGGLVAASGVGVGSDVGWWCPMGYRAVSVVVVWVLAAVRLPGKTIRYRLALAR